MYLTLLGGTGAKMALGACSHLPWHRQGTKSVLGVRLGCDVGLAPGLVRCGAPQMTQGVVCLQGLSFGVVPLRL